MVVTAGAVLGMSFTYGFSTSLISNDIIPLEQRCVLTSMPLS